MTPKRETEFKQIPKGTGMKGNSKGMLDMDLEFKNLLMETNTQGNGKMDTNMVKGLIIQP